jgi:hypothetical protein
MKREIPQHINNAINEIAEFCNKSGDCPERPFTILTCQRSKYVYVL